MSVINCMKIVITAVSYYINDLSSLLVIPTNCSLIFNELVNKLPTIAAVTKSIHCRSTNRLNF